MRKLQEQISLLLLLFCAVHCQGYQSGRNHQHQYSFRREGPSSSSPPGFTKLFQWKQLDYKFPNQQLRQQAIHGKTYVEKNSAMPLSLQADETRLFISVPRWRQGVPSTLNFVPIPTSNASAGVSSPALTPYPNLNFNRAGNCDGVTSVFRMFADQCRRLWVVDTGRVGTEQRCPAQVVAFDLATDKVIYRHRFSQEVLKCNSQPTNVAVDYQRGGCGQPKPDAFVYVTDTAAYGIIVIDTSTEKSWRVSHRSMYPAPEAGTFHVAGQQFDLMDGIVGLALGPVAYHNNERNLYYNPMTSFEQFWVPTSLLQNQNATPTEYRKFEAGLTKRATQSAGSGIASTGVLFFGLLQQNAIACWDTRKPYEQNNIATLAQNDAEMQFLSTVVVDPLDRVWALSTRFHRFFTRSMDPEEINFRVFSVPARDVVRGTPCQVATLGEGPFRGSARK